MGNSSLLNRRSVNTDHFREATPETFGQWIDEKAYDFAVKVKPIYDLLDWKWSQGRVPTVREINSAILDLARNVRSRESTWSSSGGLHVWWNKSDEFNECHEFGIRMEISEVEYRM